MNNDIESIIDEVRAASLGRRAARQRVELLKCDMTDGFAPWYARRQRRLAAARQSALTVCLMAVVGVAAAAAVPRSYAVNTADGKSRAEVVATVEEITEKI